MRIPLYLLMVLASFMLMSTVAFAGICEGACGEQSPVNSCYCDELCVEYDDCCPGLCGDCPQLDQCMGNDGGSSEGGGEKFTCDNGKKIPASFECDGIKDCDDNSDETNCGDEEGSEEEGGEEFFICNNGVSIYEDWVCDGEPDCTDGEDELGCPGEGGEVPEEEGGEASEEEGGEASEEEGGEVPEEEGGEASEEEGGEVPEEEGGEASEEEGGEVPEEEGGEASEEEGGEASEEEGGEASEEEGGEVPEEEGGEVPEEEGGEGDSVITRGQNGGEDGGDITPIEDWDDLSSEIQGIAPLGGDSEWTPVTNEAQVESGCRAHPGNGGWMIGLLMALALQLLIYRPRVSDSSGDGL